MIIYWIVYKVLTITKQIEILLVKLQLLIVILDFYKENTSALKFKTVRLLKITFIVLVTKKMLEAATLMLMKSVLLI
jgi:hypothetical protein